MVKSIILHLNESFFYRLRAHKAKHEKLIGKSLRWEEYIKALFGMKHASAVVMK